MAASERKIEMTLSDKQVEFIQTVLMPYIDDLLPQREIFEKISAAFTNTIDATDTDWSGLQGIIHTPQTHLRGIEKEPGRQLKINDIQDYIFHVVLNKLITVATQAGLTVAKLGFDAETILAALTKNPTGNNIYVPEAIAIAVDNPIPGYYAPPDRIFTMTVTTNADNDWLDDLTKPVDMYERNLRIYCSVILNADIEEKANLVEFDWDYHLTPDELEEKKAEEANADSSEVMNQINEQVNVWVERNLKVWKELEEKSRGAALTADEIAAKTNELREKRLPEQKILEAKLRAKARLERYIHVRKMNGEIESKGAKKIVQQVRDLLIQQGISSISRWDEFQKQAMTYVTYYQLVIKEVIKVSHLKNLTAEQFKVLTHPGTMREVRALRHLQVAKERTMAEMRVLLHPFHRQQFKKGFFKKIKNITDLESQNVTYPALLNLMQEGIISFDQARVLPVESRDVLNIYFSFFKNRVLDFTLLIALTPTQAKTLCLSKVSAFLLNHIELWEHIVASEIQPADIDVRNYVFWAQVLKIRGETYHVDEVREYLLRIANLYSFPPAQLADETIDLCLIKMKSILRGHLFYQTLFSRLDSKDLSPRRQVERLPELVSIANDFLNNRPVKCVRRDFGGLFADGEVGVAEQACNMILSLQKLSFSPSSLFVPVSASTSSSSVSLPPLRKRARG